MIKPKKLTSKSKIATISLSWGGPGAIPHRYDIGKQQLQDAFGVDVVETRHALKDPAWLGDHPEARAEDLMEAFSDHSIDAIFSTIGGDDSIRMLPFLDLDIIRKNPKVFMGYSDTTITHFVCHKTGLVSFYGPSIMAGFGENCGLFPYMVDAVRKTLFSSKPIGNILPNLDGWTVEFLDWADPANQNTKRTLIPSENWRFLQGKGIAQGPLIGGCLEVVEFMRGTPIWPDLERWEDAILFLETSEEGLPPVMLTYALRSYAAMGILEKLNGILFGRPGGGIPPEDFGKYDDAILKVVSKEQGLTDLPIITRMDFGHTDPMFVLPYGVQAKIDCDNKTFFIMENAVTD